MEPSEPKMRKRGREIFTTPKDDLTFSALLKEAFPGIVFAHIADNRPELEYVPSFGETKHWTITAWVSEPGWKPEWTPHGFGVGLPKVRNLPKRNFRYSPSRGVHQLAHIDGFGPATFEHGKFGASYDENDPEIRSFIDKVFRLSTKVLTNKFARVDPSTGRVVDHVSHWLYWAGRDALQRCRIRKDLFITCGGINPADNARLYLAPADYGQDEPGAA